MRRSAKTPASPQPKKPPAALLTEIMTLSARDSEAFVAALLNPPEPSRRLRQAAKRYKDLVAR